MEPVLQVEIVPAIGTSDSLVNFTMQVSQLLNLGIIICLVMEAVVELCKADRIPSTKCLSIRVMAFPETIKQLTQTISASHRHRPCF